jgi:hypothetical protein
VNKETYLKYRKEFLNQYQNLQKNELGFVNLEQSNIRNFKLFIILFSIDYIDCNYNNTTKIIGTKQYKINNKYVTKIKINSNKSMFNKYENSFENTLKLLKPRN